MSNRLSIPVMLAGGAALGAIAGVGSLMATPDERAAVTSSANDAAVRTGLKRAREPQAGDIWGGCDDARAAGTAPIYRDEPGYRPQMDGDNDGVACEPYRGE